MLLVESLPNIYTINIIRLSGIIDCFFQCSRILVSFFVIFSVYNGYRLSRYPME